MLSVLILSHRQGLQKYCQKPKCSDRVLQSWHLPECDTVEGCISQQLLQLGVVHSKGLNFQHAGVNKANLQCNRAKR